MDTHHDSSCEAPSESAQGAVLQARQVMVAYFGITLIAHAFPFLIIGVLTLLWYGEATVAWLPSAALAGFMLSQLIPLPVWLSRNRWVEVRPVKTFVVRIAIMFLPPTLLGVTVLTHRFGLASTGENPVPAGMAISVTAIGLALLLYEHVRTRMWELLVLACGLAIVAVYVAALGFTNVAVGQIRVGSVLVMMALSALLGISGASLHWRWRRWARSLPKTEGLA